MFLPADLWQHANSNARVTDVSVVSAVSVLSDTCGRGRSQLSSVGDNQAIDTTGFKEPMAAECTRSHCDICMGVSVGVHMRTNLFGCLHLFVCL